MTLQTFLRATSAAPSPALRRAITLALAVERPTSPAAYTRFYERVVDELCTTLGAPCPSDRTPADSAAA